MPVHFIIFERTLGHCSVELVQAETLRQALVSYATKVFSAKTDSRGFLTRDEGKHPYYSHPLEFIESNCKATPRYDELQYDSKNKVLLNNSGWEIRSMSQSAWQAQYAEVLCSADPWSIGEYVTLCRSALHQQFPRSRARAFMWYLQDGPLVTFYHKKLDDASITIVKRFVIPWQRQHYPNPYVMTAEMVQEWQGTYDDLLIQLKLEYP